MSPGPTSTPQALVPSIRAFAQDEWRTYRELRLRALEDSPDAFSRTLAEEEERSDEEWSARLSSGVGSALDHPLVAEVRSEPAGLVWGKIERGEPQKANVYQMWVAPNARRLGAGQMLLDAVIEWARSGNLRHLDLGVTCGNTAATRLYARAGFKPAGNMEPVRPGSLLLMQPMRLELTTRIP